jgi:hypothetical protein
LRARTRPSAPRDQRTASTYIFGAALGPPARDLVLLADARLVLEPNLYGPDIDGLLAPAFIFHRS